MIKESNPKISLKDLFQGVVEAIAERFYSRVVERTVLIEKVEG